MADELKTSPTPIQRNTFDVATELTMRYFQTNKPTSVEDMQDVFSKFFALAEVLQGTDRSKLANLIPDEVHKKIS